MSGTAGTLSPAQVEWLQQALGIGDDAFLTPMGADGPIGFNVPPNQAGQALDALEQMPNGVPLQGRTQFTPNNITAAGPLIGTDFEVVGGEIIQGAPGGVPANAEGSPAQVLEVGAGGTPTDLGLPPDPNLVQVTRTDYVPPPDPNSTQASPPQARLPQFNAEQPPPAELAGRFDTAIINNPRGYVPDLENVAQTLRPGGNIIAQGNAPYNPDFTNMLDQVPPAGETTPAGLSLVDRTDIAAPGGRFGPKPGDVMGGPFNRTEGGQVGWPNTRVVVNSQPPPELGQGPDAPGDTGSGDGVDNVGMADPAPSGEGPSGEGPSGEGPPVGAAPEAPTNAIRPIEAGSPNLTAVPGADPSPLPDYLSGPSKPVQLFSNELQPVEPGSPNLTANPTPGDPIPFELGNQPPPGQVQVRPGDGSPVADPLDQTQEVPVVETPPDTVPEPTTPTAEAGLGGAAEAGALGGAIAGGITLYDDLGKVRSGQMSAGDAAVDVGGKTAEVGGLTMAGKLVANAAGGGGDAAAAAAGGGGDAVAGAAGDAAGAGLGAAGAGGVIGGVVAGGMALIDDVGKVEDGKMTGGHATVDVAAKTAVGVGAGMAGAVAGAELGAAVGSIIPGAGTAVGLVAGAVVGGAVGYIGNALMNTETGKAVLDAAGNAVDTAIDGVKEAGEAIGDAASAAGSAVSDAASAAVDAAGSAVNAVGDAAGSIANTVSDAASNAAGAVSDAADDAVDAIKSLF
jgi:hypothetical protein